MESWERMQNLENTQNMEHKQAAQMQNTQNMENTQTVPMAQYGQDAGNGQMQNPQDTGASEKQRNSLYDRAGNERNDIKHSVFPPLRCAW